MLPSLVPLSTKAARHITRLLLTVPVDHTHALLGFRDIDGSKHLAAAERMADGWRITEREPEDEGAPMPRGALLYWSGIR